MRQLYSTCCHKCSLQQCLPGIQVLCNTIWWAMLLWERIWRSWWDDGIYCVQYALPCERSRDVWRECSEQPLLRVVTTFIRTLQALRTHQRRGRCHTAGNAAAVASFATISGGTLCCIVRRAQRTTNGCVTAFRSVLMRIGLSARPTSHAIKRYTDPTIRHPALGAG